MLNKSLLYRSAAMINIGVASLGLEARTVTVFYQGMNNTQAQAARLVGKGGFIYPYTGEKVTCSRAIDSIINLTVHPEIDEVELYDPTAPLLYYACRPITSLWFLATRVSHWYATISIEPFDDDALFSNASLWTHAVRISAINLGQEGDLADHKKRVELCRAEDPDADLVLYGVSRGSLTTFTAYAQNRYEGVKAVVLEGCPNAIPNVINATWGESVHALYRRFAHRLCAHDPEGISALAVADKFPHETPVLFITSEGDRVVPASCTLNLVDALVKAGHPNVYCLVLKNSSHIGYSFDDPEDAANYQNVAHAFYKKHNITGYNETYAKAGETLLARCYRAQS